MSDTWLQETPKFRLELGAGTSLSQALRQGQMNTELSKLGLEPSKETYQQKMALWRAAEKESAAKPPNWFARVFLGKLEQKSNLQTSAKKPCVGDNCRPARKPCAGNTCRPVPPPCKAKRCPPQVMPRGYIERCDENQGACYAHLTRANPADCEAILRRMQEEEARASLLYAAQRAACSNGAQSADCLSATDEYQLAQFRIDELRRQYQLCLMAVGP